MSKLLLRVGGSALALYIAAQIIKGFTINGGLMEYVIAGVLLTALNMLLKPLLKIISAPVILLTLGLFLIVINAVMLLIIDLAFNFIVIKGFWPLISATIIISLISFLIETSLKNNE